MTDTGASGERWQQGPERPKSEQSSPPRNPFLVAMLVLAILAAVVAVVAWLNAQFQATERYGELEALAALKVSDAFWALSALLGVGWLIASAITWKPQRGR